MPILQPSYKVPLHFTNPHISTVWASLCRKVDPISYQRECLELPDTDFIDIDWSRCPNGSNTVAIITHGLLSSPQRHYMLGCAHAVNSIGIDALAWNHRGLGGRPNRLETMTTHGSTMELEALISYCVSKQYENVVLIGWSKGGNMQLKYLGQKAQQLPPQLKASVSISAPIDLPGSVAATGNTGFYAKRFEKKLRNFLYSRKHLISEQNWKKITDSKDMAEITENYVAPLFGFQNSRAFYAAYASLQYLPSIQIPSLIINALDDPILSLTCSPVHIATNSEYIYLETPQHGGHCSFPTDALGQHSYADTRIVQFLQNILGNNIKKKYDFFEKKQVG
jgi:uncharacterized protein